MSNNRKKKNISEKRKQMYENRQRRTRKIIMISVLLIAIIGIASYFALSIEEEPEIKNIKSDQSSLIQTSSEIKIPLSKVNNEATFYSYDSEGIEIKYFIVKDSNGEIRVAFDACDVCYAAKKGYEQVGKQMRCINCGNTYSIMGLGTENLKGGCWPSYLPRVINENYAIIKISDLESKQYMFI